MDDVVDPNGFDPWQRRPRLELDPAQPAMIRKLADVAGISGIAAWEMNNRVLVGDNAIPRRIIFFGGDECHPWLTMGIEMQSEAPTCTFLELVSDDQVGVRAKHLKGIRIEELVAQIVAACANNDVVVSGLASAVTRETVRPGVSREVVRSVERMQRRRRDPSADRELLEQVAETYRRHPDGPNKAVAARFSVSERTAARWASFCTDAGLLPKAPKQGRRRA